MADIHFTPMTQAQIEAGTQSCPRCGVEVVDWDLHERFHIRMSEPTPEPEEQ